MTAVLLFLRGVPLWLWPVIVAVPMVLYERHEVVVWRNQSTVLQAEGAVEKIAALEQAKTETERRNAALKGEIDDANQRSTMAAADAASSAAAAGRLSGQLAAVNRRFSAANHSTSSFDIDAARQAVGVLSDLLSERKRADAERSKFADDAYSASLGCKRQYDSLTK